MRLNRLIQSCGVAFLLAAAAHAQPPAKLKIYINTDLEGASGVYKFAQSREPGTPLNREACEYLMDDIAGHFGVPTIMVTGDEATCREARKFFGKDCVTVAVKQGLSREAAVLYPMEETRQMLYEGAKQSVAAIAKCQPYKLELPIQARKQYLQFDSASSPGKLITKEAELPDALHILDL